MDFYEPEIEQQMRKLYRSLREQDRRRYAAIEADKLGHGGTAYIARVLRCDPATIRVGRAELEAGLPEEPTEQVRQKGGPAKLS
jgi:hypothetical protein